MNTKVTLNTTIKSLPKNEILDFAPRGNGGVFIHNGNTICHTEGEARSISKEVQNRDISAFSKPQYDNVSVSRDISVASLPQYDKHTVIASERNFSRHCETYEVSRGNLVRVAKDFRNAQLAIQGDCHESACTDSRNDEKSAFTRNSRGLPRLALSKSRNDEKAQDCHDFAFPKSRNDGQSAKSRNDKNTHSSKNLAISIATAAAMASASLNLAIAGDCVVVLNSSMPNVTKNRVECTGSFSASEFQSQLESTAKPVTQGGLFSIGTINGGSASIGAGNVSIDLANMGTAQYDYSFQFYNVEAPNTTFTFTGTHNKPLGILMPYANKNDPHNKNASRFFGIVIDTDVNYQSAGVENVYGKAMSFIVHSGTQIGRVDERSGEYLGGVTINAGKTVNAMAIYGGFAGTDRSSFVSRLTNNGTITELNLGWKEFAGDFASVLGLYNISGSGTIRKLNIYQATLTLNSDPSTWNNQTHATNLYPEHISANTITEVGEVGAGAIRINIGEGVTDANNTFLYEKLILDNTGGKKIGDAQTGQNPNFSHLSAGLGTKLHDMGVGFRVSPDIATSYGASLWRIITMSYMRRSVMTQNALDSLMKKNFKSDLSKYAQKDKEIFLNRARNQRDVNNPARINRYSPAMRKAMKQDKSTKRKSRTDKAFLDYGGNKNHIAFVLPYAAHSYAELGVASAIEWAGGAIGGVQRAVGDGIIGGYLGYEYAYTNAELLATSANVHNNSLNIGATYFQNFAFETKPAEFYIKLNLRGGLDMPIFEAQSPLPNIKFKLETNTPDVVIPLIWSAGASIRGGINFYQLKFNSYIAPELGLSYDVLSPLDMKLQKAKYKLGGNEYYPMQMWHLPQVSASVKYYKIWIKGFKMSVIGGLRYNVLNKPVGEFKIGGLSGSGIIALPILYGNVDVDLIWTLKQNHELSAGYNGLFYSNFNEFGKAAASDKFHGVSTALNLKYVYWFGGS